MTRKIFLTILLLLGIYTPAIADTENENTQQLEPMVVRAPASNEAPNSPFHLPESLQAATWSIDQKGIESLKPRDLFDVLSYAPGVQLDMQGRKGINFISSRGSSFIGGSSFAILIDGVYVPWTQSSRILASFPVDTIDTMRVVRDTTALSLTPLTGLGSMGTAVQGVVLIKTRKPEKKQSRIKASYGNLNRSKIFLNHENRFESTYYSLNYNRLNDDGRDGWNNASESNSILLKGGYEDNGLAVDASFYHDWASRELLHATEVSKTSNSKWEYDPLDTLMATANFSKKWSDDQTTALGLYTGRVSTTIHYQSYANSSYSEDDQEDNVVQADLHHIVTTSKHNLRIGGQAIFWDCPDGQFYYEGVEREEELYSGYLHEEYQLFSNLRFDAGGRIDYRHISKGINKYAPLDPTPTVPIDDEWSDPYYALAVGTAYRLSATWEASLRISYNRQGADSYLLTEDDEELNPETQLRYEAGLTAAFHPSIRATVTGFYYDIEDGKQTVGSVTVGEDVYSIYANADTVRKGMEMDIGGYIGTPNLNYALTYTYQCSDNDSDDDSMPHHIASLRLGYRLSAWQFNAMVRHVSEYDSNQFSVGNKYYEIGDFSRVDANISYDFTFAKTRMRATLFGQNLTDEEYQTRLGWKDMGITYGVELGFTF